MDTSTHASLNSMPVTALKGCGASVAEKLRRIHIRSVQDLLFHLPLRYEDRTRVYPIGDVIPGQSATVLGEVRSSEIKMGRRRMLLVRIADKSGMMTLRFFTFSAAQRERFQPGLTVRCFGEVKRGAFGPEMVHPEYRSGDTKQVEQVDETLTPVYPTTEGLKQATLRKLTDQALLQLKSGRVTELLPPSLYQHQIRLEDALLTLHRPTPEISPVLLEQGKHPAQQRLIIEELIAHNLSVLQVRAASDTHAAWPLPVDLSLQGRFLDSLPFSPTGAQYRVTAEIQHDITQPHPMMRLVQGDVGSGKTLVAALAALAAIGNGYQVALMAPTELLAEQHAINFRHWLTPLGVHVSWLSGKTKGKARQHTLEAIASGEGQMVVGTHALFQEQVQFHQLALVIIDEQHRFGVHQRLTLREKGHRQGCYPHQLIMTATPIPRTLAMTAYADLDTSVIDELPPGRTPVTTVAIPDTRKPEIIERIRAACQDQQRQVYWVCTLIEESEVLEAQAAEDTAELLKEALPELNIGLVHGRMKPAEKQAIMQQFKDNSLHLLVATTVIEVGVDVPNASLMVIENPERLGLAQLHQLRGRVGRGSIASHCVLLYHSPISKTASKRLNVLRDTNDGFLIAQRDLEIRGPGELLGTRQTGLAELKIADLVRDQALIPQVQQIAQFLTEHHSELVPPLIERWMGENTRYGNA